MKYTYIILFLHILGCLTAMNFHDRNAPVIAINGGLLQDCGNQYLGYASAPHSIQIQNNGSANLIVQSIEIPNQSSPFILVNPPMPMTISVGETSEFCMIFIPFRIGSITDSLLITSNDPITPILRVRLKGFGIYVPPAPVQNLSITIEDEDAVISWDPVTTTIFGLPITPDRYIILFSEQSGTEHFWQLANTDTLSYRHIGVAYYCPTMFYRVKAIVFYRNEDRLLLDELISLKRRLSDLELSELFESMLIP